jgi:hypothetical protein
MPLRSYGRHRYVIAFCPHCHAEDPAAPLAEVARCSGCLIEQERGTWLVRGCARHGRVVTLFDEGPEILRYLETGTGPTRAHIPDRPGSFAPLPVAYLGGLPRQRRTRPVGPFCAVQAWPAMSEQKLARRATVRELRDALAQVPAGGAGAGPHWELPHIEEGVR